MDYLKKTVMHLDKIGERQIAKDVLKAFGDRASNTQEYDFIAMLQNEIKEYENSIDTLKKALAITMNPSEMYSIRANLAKMYNHLNNPQKSIVYSKSNLNINPYDFDSIMEIGFSEYLSGNYEFGEKIMRELDSNPDVPEEIKKRVQYNLASYDLEKGLFKQGIKSHVTIGHDIGILPVITVDNIKKWNGEVEEGKTIYIIAEGGIGDEIIGVRFMNHIEKLNMIPIWVTSRNDIAKVFNRNGYKTITDIKYASANDSYYCQAFYLPVLLDLSEKEVWCGPYLTPCEKYVKKWLKILPKGEKTAFKWFGNQKYEQDLHRSISYEEILSINNRGTKISLQLEGCGEEMFDCSKNIESIEDTLAIISLCDNLVSTCTSVVHMAGSIGAKCMVMPPISCYYVWLGVKNNSHWYGKNLTIHRQTKHKFWGNVIQDINEKINDR